MKATILIGDVLDRIKEIPDQTIQCCVTSPPYWGLRDYGHDGQLGLEATPEQYVKKMVEVFREVRRILKDDGVLWLNIGDSYVHTQPGRNRNGTGGQIVRGDLYRTKNRTGESDKYKAIAEMGLRPKEIMGMPWRIAFALQSDGWYLRQDIIWHKPNPMPESAFDRCTKAHEYVFMLTKNSDYYYDHQPIKEKASEEFGTRIKRSVWTINTKPFKGAHFAVMPEALCEPPILATSQPDDLVFDPFTGSGTVATVALRHGRNYLGIELNPDYTQIAHDRITQDQPMLNEIEIR